MTKSITDRLENWAIYWRISGVRNRYGAENMTALVCDRLRDAALGNVWSGLNVSPIIDEVDAALVDIAWRAQPQKYRHMLLWTFINNAPPEVVCRKLGIKPRPHHFFVDAFNEALRSIEKTLDTYQGKNKISPTHNLIPSKNSTSDFTHGTALSEKTESPA